MKVKELIKALQEFNPDTDNLCSLDDRRDDKYKTEIFELDSVEKVYMQRMKNKDDNPFIAKTKHSEEILLFHLISDF